jgi:homoserine O-acetyltransferase
MTRFGDPEKNLFHDLPEPLTLESGAILPAVRVAYRTWGTLDAAGSNAVVVCHPLTGSADVDLWWEGLLGPGRALDPERDFIVCANVLGGCYGTTGPASPRPAGDRPWGPKFPAVTVRDMVRVQAALLDRLGVRKIRLVIGGSLGGMQVLEWALIDPERVEAIAPVAVSGRHSAWCIGLSEAQRQALYADPNWRGGRYSPEAPPVAGLAAARAVAVCTYRSRASFEERFGREIRKENEIEDAFAVESYLRHQGRKLVERFDANTYVTLTRAMDSHDVGRGRGSYEEALGSIRQPALVVAIDSDVLYPPAEQKELARLIPGARLAWLRSPHGHDAFLLETEKLDRLVRDFRAGLSPAVAKIRPRHSQPERPDGVRIVLAGATGRVGSRLRAQLDRQIPQIESDLGLRLRIVGFSNRTRMAWNDAGLDPLDASRLLDEGERNDWALLSARLFHRARARRERLVFVDCTASPFLAEQYGALLKNGIAVVTPNKLASAGPLEGYRKLRSLSGPEGVPYRYETTVGAALPVLGTLADLRRAGDRLLSLTAVLSGTLSFVLHQVNEGVPFSQAVAQAYRLGLTEPHPREDLTGEDVARKLLILLREAGYDVDRADLAVQPLVPVDLPAEPDARIFVESLSAFDAEWAVKVEAARAQGGRLFHVARFSGIGDGACPRVGPAVLPADHPAARSGPGENVVVYRTDRYSSVPLTISGPGAGPDITASGVLIDLIAAAKDLVRVERPADVLRFETPHSSPADWEVAVQRA